MATLLPRNRPFSHLCRLLFAQSQTDCCRREFQATILSLASSCARTCSASPATAWYHGKANALDEGLEPYYVSDSGDEALGSAKNGRHGRPGSANLKVYCYWDLDNKQLSGRAEVERVVPYLRRALSSLGSVHAIKAFGNTHCFNYLPAAERLARKERESQRKGDGDSHPCSMCGRSFDSIDKLKKHFTQLHQKEREKRMKSGRPSGGKDTAAKMRNRRYLDLKNELIAPKKGFGLKHKLEIADIEVRKVSNEPQAADVALKREVAQLLQGLDEPHAAGQHVVCIISDDRGFRDTFRKCRASGCLTLSISHDTERFNSCTDLCLEWRTLKEGLYEELAGLKGLLS